MASIQSLDPPSLLNILNRLCIQKLFTAGHVCVRWNELRVNSARARKQLILLIGGDAQRCIDETGLEIPERQFLVDENGDVMFPVNDQNAQLQIRSFPLEFSQFLLTHFTNLTTLTISTRLYWEEIDSIIHLLQQFNQPQGKLQTLKLHFNSDQNEKVQFLSKKQQQIPNLRTYLLLLSAVNSIVSLRKLIFDVNIKFITKSKATNLRIDLPILAQLEEFAFNSVDEKFVCLKDSLTRYAVDNQELRSIGIQFLISDFAWLFELPIELSSRFTHLNIRLDHFNNNRLDNLCHHFVNLTSLEITYYQDKFTIFSLFRPLTHLHHLISLVINMGSYMLGYSAIDVPPNERGIVHFELPSVKVFNINIHDSGSSKLSSHHFFHNCNMIRIFPNVQVVRVSREGSLCGECKKKIVGLKHSGIIELEEYCARQMFRHFTQHSRHLRMVSSKVEGINVELYGISYRQWIWNEMEPFEAEKGKSEEDNEEEEIKYPENIEKGTADDPVLIDETSEEDDEESENENEEEVKEEQGNKIKGTSHDPIQIDETSEEE